MALPTRWTRVGGPLSVMVLAAASLLWCSPGAAALSPDAVPGGPSRHGSAGAPVGELGPFAVCGRPTSPNGWRTLPTAPPSTAIPGTSPTRSLQLAPGDATTILIHVARRFNAEIEPLGSDTYGWSYRTIDGSSQCSNHASGTAIDLNATKHPQFRKGTFTAAQVGVIRNILAQTEGVIRWGGDYSAGRVDEMHFEINVLPTNPAVARVATKLRQPPVETEDDSARVQGDFNGDGRDDIGILHRNPDDSMNVWALWGATTGALTTRTSITSLPGPAWHWTSTKLA